MSASGAPTHAKQLAKCVYTAVGRSPVQFCNLPGAHDTARETFCSGKLLRAYYYYRRRHNIRNVYPKRSVVYCRAYYKGPGLSAVICVLYCIVVLSAVITRNVMIPINKIATCTAGGVSRIFRRELVMRIHHVTNSNAFYDNGLVKITLGFGTANESWTWIKIDLNKQKKNDSRKWRGSWFCTTLCYRTRRYI